MPQRQENIQPEAVLKYCVSLAAGLRGVSAPLGGTHALSSAGYPAGEISRALELFTAGNGPWAPEEGALCQRLHSMLTRLSIHFQNYYSRPECLSRLQGLYSRLASLLPDVYGSGSAEHLKEDIDPMPGVFAGEMAPLQALLGLMYRACCYQADGRTDHAAYLVSQGLDSLSTLLKQIDAGVIPEKMKAEKAEWEAFIRSADAVDPAAARSLFDRIAV